MECAKKYQLKAYGGYHRMLALDLFPGPTFHGLEKFFVGFGIFQALE